MTEESDTENINILDTNINKIEKIIVKHLLTKINQIILIPDIKLINATVLLFLVKVCLNSAKNNFPAERQ